MASPSVLSRRDGSGVKQFVFTVWTFEHYRPPHSYMRHILSLIGAIYLGFPGDSDGKESACNARDLSMIPGSERSSGEWNGHPLQYSCLESERESEVAQSCPTLCDPMDCSLPGSPTHGIFQAKYWSGLLFPSTIWYLLNISWIDWKDKHQLGDDGVKKMILVLSNTNSGDANFYHNLGNKFCITYE